MEATEQRRTVLSLSTAPRHAPFAGHEGKRWLHVDLFEFGALDFREEKPGGEARPRWVWESGGWSLFLTREVNSCHLTLEAPPGVTGGGVLYLGQIYLKWWPSEDEPVVELSSCFWVSVQQLLFAFPRTNLIAQTFLREVWNHLYAVRPALVDDVWHLKVRQATFLTRDLHSYRFEFTHPEEPGALVLFAAGATDHWLVAYYPYKDNREVLYWPSEAERPRLPLRNAWHRFQSWLHTDSPDASDCRRLLNRFRGLGVLADAGEPKTAEQLAVKRMNDVSAPEPRSVREVTNTRGRLLELRIPGGEGRRDAMILFSRHVPAPFVSGWKAQGVWLLQTEDGRFWLGCGTPGERHENPNVFCDYSEERFMAALAETHPPVLVEKLREAVWRARMRHALMWMSLLIEQLAAPRLQLPCPPELVREWRRTRRVDVPTPKLEELEEQITEQLSDLQCDVDSLLAVLRGGALVGGDTWVAPKGPARVLTLNRSRRVDEAR